MTIPPRKTAAPFAADAVKESAQQIWLAGLGAFAKAQAEGGKVFETLVQEGTSLQRKTQAAAEQGLAEAAGHMQAFADNLSARATSSWGRLETLFEERVARALAHIGTPTRRDLDALQARLDALEAALRPAPALARRASAKTSAKTKS